MSFRPVFFALGILLTILSLAMFIPALLDILDGNENWKAFVLAQLFTAFTGISLTLLTNQKTNNIRTREAFLLTSLSWVVIAAYGALPFTFSNLDFSYTDALFESMSGITTTGASIMTNLDEAPRGLLLWRSILNWLGGVGILVMALSVLPLLHVGGMQLFKTESLDMDKVFPSAAQIAASIGIIYLVMTAACTSLYSFAGMSHFDALNHAMTTIATGGFSTHNASIGHFDNITIDYIAVTFMLLGSLPFMLYLRAVRGNIRPLLKDSQVRWFLSIVIISALAVTLYLIFKNNMDFKNALRYASFNTVSIITGTGFANTDYGIWGGFVVGLFFFLMCVGGCAGSTTCGIKIFRFQVLYEVSKVQISKILMPNAIFRPHYNGKLISADVQMSVMAFFFLFALSFAIVALLLHMTGLDFITAMSGAVTTISNVGPGLGDIIGPAGNFSTLPDTAKQIMTVAMLLGRLELFTFLVMLSPYFWQK